MGKKSNQILIFKVGALGDVVFTLPILDLFDPHDQITWIVGKSSADLLRGHPRVNRLVVVDEEKLFSKDPRIQAQEAWNFISKLRRKYDLILVGHRSKLYSMALRPLIWGPIFQLSRTEKKSLWKTNVVVSPRSLHEGLALRKLALQGLERLGKREDLKKQIDSEASSSSSLRVHFSHIEGSSERPPGPYMIVHCGGGSNAKTEFELKKWPYMAELIRDLILKTQLKVILVGSRNEREEADQVLRDTRHLFKVKDALTTVESRVLNCVGTTSLRTLVDWIRNAELFVGPDSGPLHISNALGRPTVGIFGPTSSVSWGLLGPETRSVFEKLPCLPCYQDDGDFPTCNFEHACMKKLTPQKVMASIEELMLSLDPEQPLEL
jgi:ADP-heptose:LPS heptosyltransferase